MGDCAAVSAPNPGEDQFVVESHWNVAQPVHAREDTFEAASPEMIVEQIVTDAMAQVTTFAGTAGMAHLDGIDFAGKTGSAQTVSNEYKKKLGAAGSKLLDTAWFVGVSPRRNPDIAVVVLWQNGGEGYFSARLAAQVIEAYVNKQRRTANNLHIVANAVPPLAGTSPAAPAPAPKSKPTAALHSPKIPAQPMEMAALWTSPNGQPNFYSGSKKIPASIAAKFPLQPGTTLRAGSFPLTSPVHIALDESHSERRVAK